MSSPPPLTSSNLSLVLIMSSDDQSPTSPAAVASSTFYCAEDAEDVVHSHPATWISSYTTTIISSFPPPDDSLIDHLFKSEPHHMPRLDYLHRHLHQPTSRQDSINWILKVHAHYQFKPVTALRSVNYLDRFLSSHALPKNGWPYQLLSVACLSLAAKMEEPYVPLLIDLQILEPRYIFEPKTIQKMELWVMGNLNWRLRSVTPFDFLDYFISKLQSSGSIDDPFSLSSIFSYASDLILNTTRVIDFWGYTPSVVAAAAVLTSVGAEDIPDTFYARVNKETVRSCHQLMADYLVDTCPAAADPKVSSRSLEPPATPPSPIGVLDAAVCVSCDTRSENHGSVSGTGA